MEVIVLIVFFLTVTGAEGQLEGPQNMLSVVGSNVTMKCLSPSRNCSGIDWIKYSHGNPSTVFWDRGGITNAYRGRYSIDYSYGCGLIIENVELKDAGRFLCRAIISSKTVETTAYLIILENQPKCTTNVSSDDIVEGDGVQLACEVNYNGTHRASMTWNGVENTSIAVENKITISRSNFVVASAPKVPSFTCFISFSVETKDNGKLIEGLASNAPAKTCETPSIKVNYSVRNVNLSPSFAAYSPGTIITCTAEGNPAPSFKWQMMEQKINAIWQDIPNKAHHLFAQCNVGLSQYRCVATNVVREENHTAISIAFQITTLSDGVVQPIEQEISPSSRQLSVMYASIPETEAPLVSEQESTYASLREDRDVLKVSEQESAYASLREDRDVNEYASLEEKRKTKLERKSSNLSQRSTTHDVQSA